MSADGKPIQVDASTIQAAQNAQGRISKKALVLLATYYKDIVNKAVGFIKVPIIKCIFLFHIKYFYIKQIL